MTAEPESLDIVFGADPAYVQPLAALCASILRHLPEPKHARFWLVTSRQCAAEFEAIQQWVAQRGASLSILPVDDSSLPAPKPGSYYSKASFYRVLFPTLLPSQVKRALYLDCDILVRRDVTELFVLPWIDGCWVAAVANAGTSAPAELGLPPSTGYFNAGVLLVNLPAWRKENLGERLLEVARDGASGLPFYDQDALNLVVGGRWQRLDPRWNQQYEHFLAPRAVAGLSRDELREVQGRPYLVHFSGASKPWHFRDDHPFRAEYFRSLDETPFAGHRPHATGWRDWARFFARRPVPYRVRPWLHRVWSAGHAHGGLT